MSEMTLAFIALFASVAVLAGTVTSAILGRTSAGRRRLFGMILPGAGAVAVDGPLLSDVPTEGQQRLAAFVPKSPANMGRLQKRLAAAGYHGFTPALVFVIAEVVCGLLGFVLVSFGAGMRSGFLFALGAAFIGYRLPTYVVAHQVKSRQKQIVNGLPDALDLLIVSLEAGLALDQAILKCSEELAIAYPALSNELQMINVETRAGKPRIEALKNFAARTEVDDARSLVAMLVQTDRFGTSVAQALRTHAEESRIKRRQRAEEKAAKLSVKLIFPLVFCLLPAFFVIAVGPALIKFVDFFGNMKFPGK
jgi:tight adherence protein C